MGGPSTSTTAKVQNFFNGGGAAAVLAAGMGSFLLAIFAILADDSDIIKSALIFYKPTGPLSGVTTCAIAFWLIAWAALHARWKNRNLAMGRVSAIAITFLILGLLLTFPPIADLL